jgi:ABC-type nitrate/sulfonate/bicarbonate transport system substrate-binding protein
MKKNQMIAVAIVAVVVIAGIAVVGVNLNKKDSGHDLVFANGNKDCYEPTWIADQLGYYREFGADVEMMTVTGGGKALEALQSGRADIAGYGSTPLANQLNKNADDNIIVLGRWMGGKTFSEMAVLVKDGKTYDFNYPTGKAGIEVTYFDGTKATVDALSMAGSGIRIGMDTTTGYKAAIKSYCDLTGLKAAFQGDPGYDSADIKVVHVEFGNQVASLDNGDVDAIMGGSYDLAAYASLKNCVISSPSDEKFPSLVSEATCVLAATKEAYATKYTQIVGVLKALQKACCYIYGIEYADGLYLDEQTIKDKQAALSQEKKDELFGKDAVASLNGYYYTTDACKRIADFFGAPFTPDVQRLSYDKYIWAIDFELVDMKIVEATYNNSSTGTSSFRDLNAIDYMNYFDGRALFDALKDKDGKSSWDYTSWYGDAAVYFDILYNHKYTFTTGADTYKLALDVVHQQWTIGVNNTNGTGFGDGIVTVTMCGDPLSAEDFEYDGTSSTLTLHVAVTGDIVVTAEPL